MSVHATFDNTTFKNIEGYKIAACFQTENGFNGAFFIYIQELLSAEDNFIPIKMDDPEKEAKRGTLKFYDNNSYRDYTFKDIDLVCCQTFISHHTKARFLTF